MSKKRVFREGRCDFTQAQREKLTYEAPIGNKKREEDEKDAPSHAEDFKF